LKGGENVNRDILELLILTAEHDALNAILCNDYEEISDDFDTELSEKVDRLDRRRDTILTNMVKKIAPNAEA